MISLLGGTGPEGKGLAVRFALAAEEVFIGSRNESRARSVAARISSLAPEGSITGATNKDAAAGADLAFVTAPYVAQRPVLEDLKKELEGKIVVDVVAPLAVGQGTPRTVDLQGGSAALEAQAVLPGSSVVAAFQTIDAHDLLAPTRRIDSDVVVCANDSDARDLVMRLAEQIRGVRANNGGGLENARYVEGLTALLLNI